MHENPVAVRIRFGISGFNADKSLRLNERSMVETKEKPTSYR
jgi:hypothetical protein